MSDQTLEQRVQRIENELKMLRGEGRACVKCHRPSGVLGLEGSRFAGMCIGCIKREATPPRSRGQEIAEKFVQGGAEKYGSEGEYARQGIYVGEAIDVRVEAAGCASDCSTIMRLRTYLATLLDAEIAAAEKRGAERMRERCISACRTSNAADWVYARAIRALPIE